MIACGSPDLGFILILFGILGICYISSFYDFIRLVCYKGTNSTSFLVRNFIVTSVCSFFILNFKAPELFLIAPIIVSAVTFSVNLTKDPQTQK